MKANANQIRAALDAPSPDLRMFLLHGPDEAGARALAERLARAMGSDAERVDLDGATLKGDPARLADEAAAMSLFGSKRYIVVAGAGEECVEAATLLLDAPRAGNPVAMIAPAIKGSGKLVKLAQAASGAMAFANYVPDAAEAERIVQGLARDQGLRLVGGVARRLVQATGGDRAVMAREVEKIALFLDAAPDRPREVDGAAVDAIGADLSEGELSAAIDAAVEGRLVDLAAELASLDAAGTSPIPLLRQLVRKLMTLAEMRAEVDAGAGAKAVIERHKVFWRDQAGIATALRRWPSPRLAEAIARARAAERATMGGANAGAVLAQQAITAIARTAARLG